ncbi:serine hydrolase domain-containing protein [Cytophagaceae bacterium YF14B1]|uniref:Serine hydrolase domain-containing protein n=1 Tax=Xanthocytophaga flava TaxID=3048013 RepID=A0AAE3QU79_9BACT|nr:serine hydrolase domain-containing protein [Xanthocytophaga flavus]MDJ1485061.1 serine hydrolase domain-containing protein [Xanthocytophaga flavus]
MKRYLSVCFWVFLISVHSLFAQSNSSPETLPELMHEIEKVMQEEKMPGLMVSIVSKDSVLFSGGLGVSVVESRQKVDGKTLFHLYSITKMFTALAILRLIQSGSLHLQDKLKDIAPELVYTNPWESTHPVRLVHLLEHSSGFDDTHLNMIHNTSIHDLKGIDAVNFYQTCLIARWKPGLVSSYANPNYTIVGYLIEKYSGMSWDSYLQKILLEPLGMHYSDFDLRIKEEKRYARGYRFGDGHYIPFPFFVPTGNGAASALHSCAEDMTQYLRFFLNDWNIHGEQWLDTTYLSAMETIHSTAGAREGLQIGYALGNSTFYNHPKANFRGHAGGGDGFESLVNYDRRHRIGYAIANNGGKGMWRISVLIENFLTRELPNFVPATLVQQPTKPVLRDYPGYYKPINVRSEQWNFLQRIIGVVKLSQWEGGLIIKPLLGQADTVEWVKDRLFKRKYEHQASVVVGLDENGNPFLQSDMHQYYEKTSYLPVLVQQLLLGLSALAIVLSVIWVLVWLVMVLVRKVSRSQILVGLLPGMAVLSGLVAFRITTVTDYTNRIAFNSINLTSVTIFFTSLCFGLFAIAGLGLLIKQWTHLKSSWIRGILAFNAFFLTYLAILLLMHGWIGVRVWAL